MANNNNTEEDLMDEYIADIKYVSAKDLSTLETEVKKLISKEWEPDGNLVTYFDTYQGSQIFIQKMVLIDFE